MISLHTARPLKRLTEHILLLIASLACVPVAGASGVGGAEPARLVVMGEPVRATNEPNPATLGALAPLPARASAVLRLQQRIEPAPNKVSLELQAREFPLQIAEPRDTLQASIARLRVEWSAPVDGRRVARFSVNSAGAKALRVALRSDSARQMDIRVQGNALQKMNAPQNILGLRREAYSKGLQDDIWTPVTDGDQQDIELSIEDRPELRLPKITVPLISHFLVPVAPVPAAAAAPAKVSGSAVDCIDNVICQPNPTTAFLNAARATVKLVFTRQGSSYSCTGTLINDNQVQTQIPYVITAAHCVDSQATAASTNAFFFFDAAACGSDTVPSFRQLSGGASLVHVNTLTDVALLRLNDPAPLGSWFSGWDPQLMLDGSATLFMHHPEGGPKKFSIGLTLPPSLEDDVTGLHYLVTWVSGSSAGGSNGGGLFTLAGDQYMLRGVLHGGSASCAVSGQPQNPLNRDFFTHLDEDAEALRRILLGGPAPLQNYGDLWNSTTELGWGMTIFQSADNQILLAWYTHDEGGNPVWYLSLGGKWVSAVRYEGLLARVMSTPATMTYDPSRLSSSNAGSVALDFTSGDRANMTFTLNGVTRTKPLKRFTFGP
ncbi:MAG: trypsin-like peptidase domain-containing protein [Burkholderiales bacterium]|nr:trypsin-like peptidase domain-containing protein [Burkholderiales bacterium]